MCQTFTGGVVTFSSLNHFHHHLLIYLAISFNPVSPGEVGEEAHQPSWTKHEQEALDCKQSLKNRGKQFYQPSRENGKPSAMETEVFPTHFPIPLPCQLVTWGCTGLGSTLPGSRSSQREEDAPRVCWGWGGRGARHALPWVPEVIYTVHPRAESIKVTFLCC